MTTRWTFGLVAWALLAMPAAAQPVTTSPTRTEADCAALAGLDLSAQAGAPARIATAAVVRDGRPAAVCHARGTLRGTIGFEAWLPLETWTGRYLQIGCGGLCGRVPTAPPQVAGCVPFERGEFATAATDMGHNDPSAASWGADPERRLDFAHRAQHLTAVAAKALIARFYGMPASRSYFAGCSDGGREALLAATLHPEDFDGIVAGAPVVDWTAQNTFHHAWTVQRNRRADGSAALTADRLPVLNRLVRAACGGGEVVADPLNCRFDPRAQICAAGADPATCLTEDEARTAAAIYDGPRTASGERLTAGGLALGSEANWAGVVAPADAATPPRARLFSTGVLRHLAFAPGATSTPAPDALAYDTATFARMADARRLYDATATDLGRFFARGGRLIVWHGLADQDIAPRNTVAWWGALRRDLGAAAVDGSSRLFLIPGLAHCRGGVGLTDFDSLTPLLRWVEDGAAPGDLAGRVPATRDVSVEPFHDANRYGPRR